MFCGWLQQAEANGVEVEPSLVGNLIRRRERERERERVLAAVHQFLMYIHRQKKSRNKRRKKEEEGKNNCQSSGNKKPRRK